MLYIATAIVATQARTPCQLLTRRDDDRHATAPARGHECDADTADAKREQGDEHADDTVAPCSAPAPAANQQCMRMREEEEVIAEKTRPGEGLEGRDAWGDIQVRLLPKPTAPKAFKAPSPITILQTSVNIFSKTIEHSPMRRHVQRRLGSRHRNDGFQDGVPVCRRHHSDDGARRALP